VDAERLERFLPWLKSHLYQGARPLLLVAMEGCAQAIRHSAGPSRSIRRCGELGMRRAISIVRRTPDKLREAAAHVREKLKEDCRQEWITATGSWRWAIPVAAE